MKRKARLEVAERERRQAVCILRVVGQGKLHNEVPSVSEMRALIAASCEYECTSVLCPVSTLPNYYDMQATWCRRRGWRLCQTARCSAMRLR